MGAMNRTPTPTECMLQLFMRNQCLFHVYTIFVPTSRCGLSSYTNVYPRTPTVGSRFIVPAYHGGVDILCFICFVFHLCHSICALMIFFFGSKHSRSIEKPPFHLTHYANVLKLKDHTSSELDEPGDHYCCNTTERKHFQNIPN